MKKTFIIYIFLLVCTTGFSQSKNFKLGQWSEIQNAILKVLDESYVDSLPVDRIQRAAIDAMLEELDPYTIYIPEEENEDLDMMLNKSYGGIGAVIYKPDVNGNVIINEPYFNSPAHRAGLVCGDEIEAIDGETTHSLTSSEASEKMRGKPGTSVTFRVKRVRGGHSEDVTVVRERIHYPDIEYAGMLNETDGYILQSGFTVNVSSELREAVIKLKEQGMERLFLDLRGNGGGVMQEAVNIVSLFVPKGETVVTSRGSDGENVYKTTSEPLDTLLPLVVLVDSGSASASEIVAGAIQDLDRGIIMGKRTYGKGLVQRIRSLPYNGTMKLTVAKYYTPSGRCVQAIDYSNRSEDGSVGHIPDSLTHEFRTVSGRIVRDGGGITPDIAIDSQEYSRLTYSLVLNGIIEQYVLDYVRSHESIPAIDDFHFSDSDYATFVEYAKTKDFDYRSSAKTYFDQMKKELEKDALAQTLAPELDALEKALDMEKEQFLNLKKSEIIPFIEEEIAVRYYFQEAGIRVRLRYDTQLKTAIEMKRTESVPRVISAAGPR